MHVVLDNLHNTGCVWNKYSQYWYVIMGIKACSLMLLELLLSVRVYSVGLLNVMISGPSVIISQSSNTH